MDTLSKEVQELLAAIESFHRETETPLGKFLVALEATRGAGPDFRPISEEELEAIIQETGVRDWNEQIAFDPENPDKER